MCSYSTGANGFRQGHSISAWTFNSLNSVTSVNKVHCVDFQCPLPYRGALCRYEATFAGVVSQLTTPMQSADLRWTDADSQWEKVYNRNQYILVPGTCISWFVVLLDSDVSNVCHLTAASYSSLLVYGLWVYWVLLVWWRAIISTALDRVLRPTELHNPGSQAIPGKTGRITANGRDEKN